MSLPDWPDQAAPAQRVHVNRTLNLRSIKAIGYDMDYTLVGYNEELWEERAYAYLKEKLIEEGWDSAEVRGLVFDATRVIRGLVVDMELGNLIKLNRFAYVKAAHHGTEPMSVSEVRAAYPGGAVDLTSDRFRQLDTLFSLSEGCIFAQLVSLYDRQGLPGALGYRGIWTTVRRCLDQAHIEGELKRDLLADPDSYLRRDPLAARTLIEQRAAGKKLMLITNSGWNFTRQVMALAYDPYLPEGTTWRDLFDVVIVSSRKPTFFRSNQRFFEIMDERGDHLRPFDGTLRKGAVYLGGDAHQLESLLGLSGDEILYVGDHIYGDVIVSKNQFEWRTCLVLSELEGELAYLDRVKPIQEELDRMMAEKAKLEIAFDRLRCCGLQEGAEDSTGEQMELRSRLVRLDAQLGDRLREMATHSNPYWGPLMRAGADESLLASQVGRFACVYTAAISGLGQATPFHYFRAGRLPLPHDP